MKKLLLMLVACLTAIVANAAGTGIYVRGAQFGWDNCTTANEFQTTDQANVISITLTSLSGSFKIAVNDWNSSDQWGGKDNDLNVSMGNSYTLEKSNYSKNLIPAESWTDVTLTLNTSTNELTISGKASEKVITWEVYGQITSSGWNGCVLTETQSGSGVWEGTYKPYASSGEFGVRKMADGQQEAWYAGSTSLTLSESNTSVTLANSGNLQNVKYNLTAGREYTFTWTESSNTLSISWDDDEPVVKEYPDKVYVIGTLPNNIWSSSVGELMTKSENGVYTIDNLQLVDNDGKGAAFSFCTQLGSWEDVNAGSRWGAAVNNSSDVTIQSGQQYTLVPDNDPKAFIGGVGTYSIKIDLENLTMVATWEATKEPAPETFYIMGDVNGNDWSPNKNIPMEGSNGQFTAKNIVVVENIEAPGKGYIGFATQSTALDAASGGWDNLGTRYGAGSENLAIVSGQPMTLAVTSQNYSFEAAAGTCYDIAVNFGEDGAPTVTFTEVTDVTTTYCFDGDDDFTFAVNGNTASWAGVLTPQNFVIEKKVNGYVVATYYGEEINDFGEFDSATTATQWSLTDNVVNADGSPIALSFNTETLVLTVSTGISADAGTDTTEQSGEVTDNKTITLQSENDAVLVFLSVPEEATAVYYQLSNVTEITSPSAVNVRRAAPTGYKEASKWYGKEEDKDNGRYAVSLTTGTQGNLSVIYEIDGAQSKPQEYTFVVTKSVPTGVDGIAADEEGAEYYSLDGVKVQNPDKGIYIRVQNGVVSKVVK